MTIRGTVIDDPFYRYLYFRRAEVFVVTPISVKASGEWHPAYGNIRVTSYNDKKVTYGDDILFEATLKMPFSTQMTVKGRGAFDYKKYLARFGIYGLATISDKDALIVIGRGKGSRLQNLAYNVKDAFKRRIEWLFRPPERYFLSAVLLGERQDIPREWMDILTKTQTMHLIAISGLHVGIIAFITLFLLGFFGLPQNLKYIFTIILLVFYAVMVGGRPSVVRATIMGTTFLGAYLLKRDADIYNSLGLAAVCILLYNPDQLFDYGFILSFGSVFFIIYAAPLFNRVFRADRCRKIIHIGGAVYYFLTLFSASLAVWLGLLPPSVNFFNIISPVSIAVNILAIPVFFVIMALSLFAVVSYFIFPFLGAMFAQSTDFFIDALMSFLSWGSKLPFAYFEVASQNILAVIFYYAALFGIVEYFRSSIDNI